MSVRAAITCLLLAGSMAAQATGPSKPPSDHPPSLDSASIETPKIDPGKEADIRRLMDLVGAGALGSQMMDEMQKNIKPMMIQAFPPGEYREQLVQLFFDKFRAKCQPQQLVDLAVPSYDHYFTHQEIRGLIEFYQTPLGQKAVSALPRLMIELQEIGRKWGEGIGRDSMQEVLAERPDLAKALEDAKRNPQP